MDAKAKAQRQRWFQKHKVEQRDKARLRYQSDPAYRARYRTYQKKWRTQLAPEKQEAMHRRATLGKYGLSLHDFEGMLAAQGGVCSICQRTHGRRLHVDHCHATGRVRGLLCWRCNNALGLIGEENLVRAVAYLRR